MPRGTEVGFARLYEDIHQGWKGLITYRGIRSDPVLQSFQSLIVELGPILRGDAKSESAPMEQAAIAYYSFLSQLLTTPTPKPSWSTGTLWQEHFLDTVLSYRSPSMEALCRGGEPWEDIFVQGLRYDLQLLSRLFWAFEDGLGELLMGIMADVPLPEKALLQRSHGGLDLGDFPRSGGEKCADSVETQLDPGITKFRPLLAEEVLAIAASKVKCRFYRTRDWTEVLPDLIDYHQRYGTGEYTCCAAFTWDSEAEGDIVGIVVSDPIQLHELSGYEEQVEKVVLNTRRFLQGLPAHNLLLYGDRGTGKSSTVKGLIHRFAAQGLRLVEVGRGQLSGLRKLTEYLRGSSLRFIVFIDDLSFEEDETEFKELKSILEGSVVSQPENVRIYATSNRRHLIKEKFSDARSEDEVRWQDTVQEKLSLSDRFGLTIVYPSPDQKTYLAIVEHLAEMAQLPVGKDELRSRALQWTLWHNERSGRTARQFIDELKAELQLKP